MGKMLDFECTYCGHRFEELTWTGEDIKCPKCGDTNCKRLPNSVNFYTIKGDNSASTRPKSS